MKKRVARLLAFALTLVMVLPMAVGCGKSEQSKKVVFNADDAEVTLDEVWFYCKSVQEYYESYYSTMFSSPEVWTSTYPMEKEDGTTVDSTLENVAKRSAIKQIRQIKIAVSHADELKVTLSEDEEKAVVTQAKSFMENVTKAEKDQMGITQDLAESVFRESAIVEKMKEKLAKKKGVEISDEEAQTSKIYYVYFPTTAYDDQGNVVTASEENVKKAKEDAESALEKIKGGNDIATVAAAYGMGGSSGQMNIDADSNLPEEITNAISGLKDGETLEKVVSAADGFYLFQMINVVDENATADRKAKLLSQKQQELLDKKFEKWTEKQEFDYDKDVNWEYMDEIDFVATSSVKAAATPDAAAQDATEVQDVKDTTEAVEETGDEEADEESEDGDQESSDDEGNDESEESEAE